MNSFQVQNVLGAGGMETKNQGQIRLFSTDLDGTLLGTPESAKRFRTAWKSLPDEHAPLLCYNTGRTIQDTLSLIKNCSLVEPNYLIGGVGTHIYDFQQKKELEAFYESFGHGWDLGKIESILKDFPGVSHHVR
jgi:hydroxymethylpyrimidine pyrophosphatase-like HAD family hydrolase